MSKGYELKEDKIFSNSLLQLKEIIIKIMIYLQKRDILLNNKACYQIRKMLWNI